MTITSYSHTILLAGSFSTGVSLRIDFVINGHKGDTQ